MVKATVDITSRLRRAERKLQTEGRRRPVNRVPVFHTTTASPAQTGGGGPNRHRVYADALRLLHPGAANYMQTYGRTRQAIAETITSLVMANMDPDADTQQPLPVQEYDPTQQRDVYLEAYDGLVNAKTIYIVTEYRNREKLQRRDTSDQVVNVRSKGGEDGAGGRSETGSGPSEEDGVEKKGESTARGGRLALALTHAKGVIAGQRDKADNALAVATKAAANVYEAGSWVLIRTYGAVSVAHKVVLQVHEVGRVWYNGEGQEPSTMTRSLWAAPAHFVASKLPVISAALPASPSKKMVLLSIAAISAEYFWDAPALSIVDPEWLNADQKVGAAVAGRALSITADSAIVVREVLTIGANPLSLRAAHSAYILAAKMTYDLAGANTKPLGSMQTREAATRVLGNILIDTYNGALATKGAIDMIKKHDIEINIPPGWNEAQFEAEVKAAMDGMATAPAPTRGSALSGAMSYTTKQQTVHVSASSSPYYLYPLTITGGPASAPVTAYIDAGQESSALTVQGMLDGVYTPIEAASLVHANEWADVSAQVAVLAVVDPTLFTRHGFGTGMDWIWQSSMPTFTHITTQDTMGLIPSPDSDDLSRGVAAVLSSLGQVDTSLNVLLGSPDTVSTVTAVTKLMRHAPSNSYTPAELNVMFDRDVVGQVDRWRHEWTDTARTQLHTPLPIKHQFSPAVYHETRAAMFSSAAALYEIDPESTVSREMVVYNDFKPPEHTPETSVAVTDADEKTVAAVDPSTSTDVALGQGDDGEGKVSVADDKGGKVDVATEAPTAAPTAAPTEAPTVAPTTATSAPTEAEYRAPYLKRLKAPSQYRDNLADMHAEQEASRATLRNFLPDAGTVDLDDQDSALSRRLKANNLLLGQFPSSFPLGTVDNRFWVGNMVREGVRFSGELNASPTYYMGGSLTEGDSQWGTQRVRMPVVPPPLINGQVFQ